MTVYGGGSGGGGGGGGGGVNTRGGKNTVTVYGGAGGSKDILSGVHKANGGWKQDNSKGPKIGNHFQPVDKLRGSSSSNDGELCDKLEGGSAYLWESTYSGTSQPCEVCIHNVITYMYIIV